MNFAFENLSQLHRITCFINYKAKTCQKTKSILNHETSQFDRAKITTTQRGTPSLQQKRNFTTKKKGRNKLRKNCPFQLMLIKITCIKLPSNYIKLLRKLFKNLICWQKIFNKSDQRSTIKDSIVLFAEIK